MAIILRKKDNKPEVLLNVFDRTNFDSANKITISFHKMMHGAVNFSDKSAIAKVKLAIEEISDLIY